MKIELKPIIDQLTEAIGLSNGRKVAALIEDDGSLVGWTIVKYQEDGTIQRISDEKYDTIKDLIEAHN